MMTNREVIQQVLDYLQSVLTIKGLEDRVLDRRLVYSKLISNRARLLVQEHSKNKNLSYNCYQTLRDIELIEAQNYTSDCLPAVGFKVMKSKYELPSIIQARNIPLVKQVSTLNSSIQYSYIHQNSVPYRKGARFTSEKADFYIDEHLFLVASTLPKVVKMVAIFEKPDEVINFNGYCNEADPCNKTLNNEFYLDERLIPTVVEMAARELQIFRDGDKEG